jgi:hypothetical protein
MTTTWKMKWKNNKGLIWSKLQGQILLRNYSSFADDLDVFVNTEFALKKFCAQILRWSEDFEKCEYEVALGLRSGA